jgi:hypothetical protein
VKVCNYAENVALMLMMLVVGTSEPLLASALVCQQAASHQVVRLDRINVMLLLSRINVMLLLSRINVMLLLSRINVMLLLSRINVMLLLSRKMEKMLIELREERDKLSRNTQAVRRALEQATKKIDDAKV